MDKHTLQNEKLSVSIECETDGVYVILRDEASGAVWPRVPLLLMEVYDRASERLDSIDRLHIEQCQRVNGSVHITLGDPARGVSVGLWLKIDQGSLSVVLHPAEVYERTSILYRIYSLNILPGMMQAGNHGLLLLPLNTGVICRPAGKPALKDCFLIYGEQNRWELLPTLPVCAVQTPAGGLVALAASGDAETECRVSTDGQGRGDVGFAFHLRGEDPDQIAACRREIRYTPIAPGKDVVTSTAVVLRQHVTQTLGKRTLLERAAESPEVKHLMGAYVMKLFYGVQKQGMMFGVESAGEGAPFQLCMTFGEAKAALQSLSDAGVSRIYTQNVGWNFRGHDGAYPTRFPIEERVGGEAAFRDLIRAGHEMGHQMSVHDNYMDAYECSPDFDPKVIMRDRYGQPQLRGFWGGGASYLQWPEALEPRQLQEQMLRVKELGIRGPYYLDGMGSPLYKNYLPDHFGTRTDHMKGQQRLLQTARDLYGSVATETAFLYCSILPDLVNNPGNEHLLKLCKPYWPITQLLDQSVPLWNIAMSGLVFVENQGMDWPTTMQALLLGQKPRYEWSTRPGVHPVLDRPLIGKIKARFDLLIKRFGHLSTMQITDYHEEGHVHSSRFEDGTTVVADFTTGKLNIKNQNVPRPPELPE